MKLQKLVYFAHGWNLGLYNAPLFGEPVQAWRYGPVVYSVYREFRDFQDRPITQPARDVEFRGGQIVLVDIQPPEDARDLALIGQVWEIYRGYSATQLSNMTHERGSPWDRVAARFEYKLPKGITIPNQLIHEYFAGIAANQPA